MPAIQTALGVDVEPGASTLREIRILLRSALPTDRREQAISYAYGQASMSNPNVTRAVVEALYDEMHPRCAHG